MAPAVPPLPALLQAASGAASGTGDSRVLLGYVLVAAGAGDLVVSVLLLLTEKPADPRARKVVVGALGFCGFSMIAVGALLWLGVIG